MKKFICAIMLICAIFLQSCGETSMKELLSFQSASYTAELAVNTNGKVLPIILVKDGDTFTFSVDEKYTFVLDGGVWHISYGGMSMAISEKAAERSLPKKLHSALTAAQDANWEIEKENSDGKDIFVCKCKSAELTFCFDAQTSLPSKILLGDTECDVMKFEISE